MMSSNLEDGGIPAQQTDSWWLNKWSGWLATMGALLLGFVSLLGIALNLLTFSLFSAIAAGTQV